MRYFYAIFILVFSGKALAQSENQLHYRFRHINQAEGLAGNHVMNIAQDSKGYIWIATLLDGIQRYDGIRFKRFGNEFFNPATNTFQVNGLWTKDGALMASSLFSTYIYNPYEKRFTEVKPDINGKDGNTYTDEEGIKWYVTPHYVMQQIRPDASGQPEWSRVSVNALVEDTLGKLFWVSKKHTLYKLNPATKQITTLKKETDPLLYDAIYTNGKLHLSNMHFDTNHDVWISSWHGTLYKYNFEKKVLKQYPIRKSTEPSTGPVGVNLFFRDKYNQLWLSTYGAGLLKYNPEKDQFDYILANKNDPQGLWYNYEIKALFQDSEDNIWVGSDMGISIFNPYKDYFKLLRQVSGRKDALPPYEIETVYQISNKDIWVGTWGGGITVYDSSLKFKNRYRFDVPDANLIWSFAEDKQNRVWVGCQEGIINRYDKRTGIFEKSFTIPGNRSTIRQMVADNQGNLYFGMQNGLLAKWDARTNQYQSVANAMLNPGGPSPVHSLFLDTHNNLWLANSFYLYRYNPATLKCQDSILIGSKPTVPYTPRPAIGITPFSDSIFLISSRNGDAGYLNVYTHDFRPWKVPAAIQKKRITAIQKDHRSTIWFTAGLGIYNFRVGNEQEVHNYINERNMVHSPFDNTKSTVLSDGRKAFYTSTEVLIFDPADLSGQAGDQQKVAITGIRIFDQDIPLDSLLDSNTTLTLNHKQNFLSIDFSPLLFSPFQKKKYWYKLSGIDPDWVSAEETFTANYTSLKPGHYIFSVKADGQHAQDVTSFSIRITPPFYNTWWFYTLSVLAVGSLVFYLLKRRIKNIRQKAELKQKILETEMAALRAQMNPHFIFNCLSAIDNLIQGNEKDKATTYLARFARLIRNVLDSSKNNIIPFHKDLETTRLFIDLERFRSNNKFTYTLEADDNLVNGDYKVPPLLMQPFIENAIHHGLFNKTEGDKRLTVSATLSDGIIVYSICDNGVGRARAEQLKQINRPEHISYGIQISEERVKRFNYEANAHLTGNGRTADVTITDLYDNNTPAGTCVQILLKPDSFK